MNQRDELRRHPAERRINDARIPLRQPGELPESPPARPEPEAPEPAEEPVLEAQEDEFEGEED